MESKEHQKTGVISKGSGARTDESRKRDDRLSMQQVILLRLALSSELHGGDLQSGLAVITEAAGRFIEVERTSVWVYNGDNTGIRCLDLFELSQDRHSDGTELFAKDYPNYFEALSRERAIAAHDAHQDPRTSEFSRNYLKPLNISSMLDAPFRLEGRMLGVVCHEHVGPPREWSEEAQGFAGSIGDLVALVIASAERRELETRMRQAQKLESLGVLAGGIAHDFNNLLVGVLGNTSLLLSKLEENSPHRQMLTDIEEAARQATDLTDKLLAYSGSGRFMLEPVDLNGLVTGLAHLSEKVISSSTPIHYELDDELPPVEGDPTQLRQIIMNIVTNASEAIEKTTSGAITIRTGTLTMTPEGRSGYITTGEFNDGKHVYLEVEDNGCGISDEHLSKLFDPFYTTKFTGRGLGLAAVMGIVNSHKGAIRIRTTEGKGTTFRILFPLSRKPRTEIRKENIPLIDHHGTGLILVIDDDPTVRRVTRAILKEYGYGVITCSTGASAINVFRKRAEAIDCVILDLTLPEISGQELFRQLKEISPDVRVLLSSGHSSERIDKTFPRGSVDGFLKKPYDIATFLEKLREVLPTD